MSGWMDSISDDNALQKKISLERSVPIGEGGDITLLHRVNRESLTHKLVSFKAET